MATRESSIQQRILDKLTSIGAMAVVFTVGPHERIGTPDIVGVYRGRGFAIECKNSEYDTTDRQNYEGQRWRKAGAYYTVARNWGDVQSNIIDEIDRLE